MKIDIKKIKDDIVQVTTVDERWYIKTVKGKDIFYPSVTWICYYYPKGISYFKWLANKGWDEAEAIKVEAGERGSKVHNAIHDLVCGKEVKMDDKYFSESKGQDEELSVDEWEAIVSFRDWFSLVKPEVIASEVVGFNDKDKYAGTMDCICLIRKNIKYNSTEITRGFYLLDWKTSQDIWPSYEIQVSAYRSMVSNDVKKQMAKLLTPEEAKDKEFKKIKLGILQVGYRRNKNKFKFTMVDDKYNLFLATKKIWENECASISPRQIDYPRSLKL